MNYQNLTYPFIYYPPYPVFPTTDVIEQMPFLTPPFNLSANYLSYIPTNLLPDLPANTRTNTQTNARTNTNTTANTPANANTRTDTSTYPKKKRPKSSPRYLYQEELSERICHICNKIFSRKGNLTRHLKLHNGLRPYVCIECGQRCACKSNLESHMKVHEKPIASLCEYCGKNFRRPGFLKKHSEKHAKIGHKKIQLFVEKAQKMKEEFKKVQAKRKRGYTKEDNPQSGCRLIPQLLPPRRVQVISRDDSTCTQTSPPKCSEDLYGVDRVFELPVNSGLDIDFSFYGDPADFSNIFSESECESGLTIE